MRHRVLIPPLNWQFYLLALICGLFAPFNILPATICAILTVFFAKKLHDLKKIVIYAGFFAFGFAIATFFSREESHAQLPEWAKENNAVICGKIITTSFLPEERLRLILDELHPEAASAKDGIRGLCALTIENASQIYPMPGQTVCTRTQLKRAGGFANSFSENETPIYPKTEWRSWSDNNKYPVTIHDEATWLSVARHKVFSKFLQAISPDGNSSEARVHALTQGQAIITALIFGDRRFLDQHTVNLFSNASLAHSLALSGQHLGIAVLFAFVFTIGLAQISPSLYLWQPKIILSSLISIFPASLYLWLGGAPPSLLRAFGMLCFFALLTTFKKPATLADLLFLALSAILLFEPLAIHNIGIQLSALCIIIIYLASRPLFHLQLGIPVSGKLSSALARHILQILLLSFIIQLALLPISLARFQQTGLWFPLNVLWLPVLGFFILPLSALGLLCALPASPFFNEIATQLLRFAEYPCQLLLNF